MTPRRSAAVAALLTGIVASLWAGPAVAQEVTVRDPAGDLWFSSAGAAAEPSPGSTFGDLTRTVVNHNRKAVVVRLRFVDLGRRGSYAQYAVLLEGSRDRKVREVVVEASRRNWAGRVRVFKRNGDLVRTCGARHRIDYDANTVTARLPRTCLNRPGSVRANVNVYRADGGEGVYSDNAHDALEFSRAWTPWVKRPR